MDLISFSISTALYLLFLALGIFIIIQNPQSKFMRYMGLGMLCGGLYIFGIAMCRLDFPLEKLRFWSRWQFIPAELAMLFWFLAFVDLSNNLKAGIRLRSYVVYLIIVISLAVLFIISFTNLIVDYSDPIYIGNQYVEWDFRVTFLHKFRMLLEEVKIIYPIVTLYAIIKKSKKSRLPPFTHLMLLASILLFLGVTFSMLQFDLGVTYNLKLYNINPNIQEFFILIGMLIITWLILNPSLLIKDSLEVARDFFSYVGYSLLLITPYVFIVLGIIKFFDSDLVMYVLFHSIAGLVILSHSTNEWIIELVKTFFKGKGLSIPKVLPSDINEALKYYTRPNELRQSRLLKLDCVQVRTQSKNITKVEALREVIANSIEYFRPNGASKRDIPWLRYEILRMMAFEEALESQIMWELGFDVFVRSREEKVSEFKEPKYKIRDSSEYSATSGRSFKRLRKEALEMLGWKLSEPG